MKGQRGPEEAPQAPLPTRLPLETLLSRPCPQIDRHEEAENENG